MTLTRETKTTIGMAGTVIMAAVGITMFVNNKLMDIQRDLQALKSRITDNESAVTKSYTLAAASEQALRLAMENPGLRVPDPRDPNRLIEVKLKPGS